MTTVTGMFSSLIFGPKTERFDTLPDQSQPNGSSTSKRVPDDKKVNLSIFEVPGDFCLVQNDNLHQSVPRTHHGSTHPDDESTDGESLSDESLSAGEPSTEDYEFTRCDAWTGPGIYQDELHEKNEKRRVAFCSNPDEVRII